MAINRSDQQWPEGFGLDMAGEVEQEWRDDDQEWLELRLAQEIEDLTRLVEGAELRAGLRRVGLLR